MRLQRLVELHGETFGLCRLCNTLLISFMKLLLENLTNLRKFSTTNDFHYTVFTTYMLVAGLHLGNNSRGGKIRFYESKGGNGIKTCMCKHTASGDVGVCPPGNFCILDSFRLFLVHSQVATASVERSFSQMKLIKTHLRSSLNDKKLF